MHVIARRRMRVGRESSERRKSGSHRVVCYKLRFPMDAPRIRPTLASLLGLAWPIVVSRSTSRSGARPSYMRTGSSARRVERARHAAPDDHARCGRVVPQRDVRQQQDADEIVVSAWMRSKPFPSKSSLPSWRKSGSSGSPANRACTSSGELRARLLAVARGAGAALAAEGVSSKRRFAFFALFGSFLGFFPATPSSTSSKTGPSTGIASPQPRERGQGAGEEWNAKPFGHGSAPYRIGERSRRYRGERGPFREVTVSRP